MSEKLTLIFDPKPRNKQVLSELTEAMTKAGLALTHGSKLNEMEVNPKDVTKATRILEIHGYKVKQLHESTLTDAITKLATKYRLDEEVESPPEPKSKPDPQINKKSLTNFIQRQARSARKTRDKRRAQHVRDKLDGQIQAYEEVLRRLKKT